MSEPTPEPTPDPADDDFIDEFDDDGREVNAEDKPPYYFDPEDPNVPDAAQPANHVADDVDVETEEA